MCYFTLPNKPPRIKDYVPFEYKWYHDGPWWEHPIYKPFGQNEK